MQKYFKFYVVVLFTFLSACGGGGSTTQSPVVVPAPPVATTYTLGGSVTGLPSGTTLSIQNNGGDTVNVTSNTTFTFPTSLVAGQSYLATVSAAPSGYTCIGQNVSGIVAAKVSNITFACSSGTYTSVSTNVAQVTYPTTYTTADNNPNSNVCDLASSKVSYPQSWNGVQNLPTVTGAPLSSGVITAMIIKDILPNQTLPNGCSKPSNFSEFTKTVARLKSLNVNAIMIGQWHWAQINSDGTYKITGDTGGALSDADLAQYVSIARTAGMKVILVNQIQGFVDSSGVTNIPTPEGNSTNWGRWLNAFETFMLERANKFQALGIDYWEMGCNACIYGDKGDGSTAASQQFSDAYLKILNLVSNIYKGKKFVYENSWIRSNTQYLAGIDLLGVGLWTGNITSAEESTITVASMKSKFVSSNATANLSSILSIGKPVMAFAGIQSRSNALSLPGYMEETQCTNSVGSLTFSISCIQRQTTTNFALQAIFIEAQLETFASFALPTGSIVGISDYFQTDFMSADGPTFPNLAYSIRNKPAEGIVKQWFAGH